MMEETNPNGERDDANNEFYFAMAVFGMMLLAPPWLPTNQPDDGSRFEWDRLRRE